MNEAKVLFIGAFGRSGSTLIDLLLGQHPNIVAVGELVQVWERGVKQNALCGCGSRFRECEFWTAVFQQAFGGMATVDPEHLTSLMRRVYRTRHIPAMLYSALRLAQFDADLSELRNCYELLFGAIAKVSGAEFIVDSSKAPPYAVLINKLPGVRFHLLHLIRDSRAVAYSWSRVRDAMDTPGSPRYLARFSPSSAATQWGFCNLAFTSLSRNLEGRSQRLRYEDFVSKPKDSLNAVVNMVTEGRLAYDFDRISSSPLQNTHSIGGNPMRFSKGPLTIREDSEWKTQMSKSSRLIVTLLTLPHLIRYGYV